MKFGPYRALTSAGVCLFTCYIPQQDAQVFVVFLKVKTEAVELCLVVL